MTPDQLLAGLRDVHTPPEPHWWPPAPGWWVVLLLAVMLAAIAIRYAMPRLQRWRRRRRLLAALAAIERRYRAGASEAQIAADVSQLLRVAALERFPERGVAGLHGKEWIAFLESCDRAPARFDALHEALTVVPYRRPDAGADAAPLLRAARGWLRAVV